MAHLYASLSSDVGRRETTKSENSRIGCHIRGWNIGVRVEIKTDADRKDNIWIYRTYGSNGHESDELITSFKEE